MIALTKQAILELGIALQKETLQDSHCGGGEGVRLEWVGCGSDRGYGPAGLFLVT